MNMMNDNTNTISVMKRVLKSPSSAPSRQCRPAEPAAAGDCPPGRDWVGGGGL